MVPLSLQLTVPRVRVVLPHVKTTLVLAETAVGQVVRAVTKLAVDASVANVHSGMSTARTHSVSLYLKIFSRMKFSLVPPCHNTIG